MEIIEFDNSKHRQQVVALWQNVFGYESDHNVPELVIDKKIAVRDGLFFVASADQTVVGTVMAGYDGHRGWIYSMAVLPNYQKKGIGSALLKYAEKRLSALGCLKVNLQIMEGNEEVEKFYRANGYSTEKRISMGKKLYENSKLA
jgi:ribosomal protein S18 acetylase RimI-like enzyme